MHGPLSVLVATPRPEVGEPSHRMLAMIVPSLFSTSCASSIPQRLVQPPGPRACTTVAIESGPNVCRAQSWRRLTKGSAEVL